MSSLVLDVLTSKHMHDNLWKGRALAEHDIALVTLLIAAADAKWAGS